MSNVKDFDYTLNGRKLNVRVKTPSAQDLREGQTIYAKSFSQAVKDGYMLRAQAWKVMEEQGIWTKKDDDEWKNILKKMFDYEYKLTTSKLPKGEIGKIDENTTFGLAITMKKLREQLYNLQLKRTALDNNTAEAYAENMRLNYLAYKCITEKESGKQIFESFQEFDDNTVKMDNNTEEYGLIETGIKAFTEVYLKIGDNKGSAIEDKILEKFGFTDKDGHLINSKKEFVDYEGNRVNKDGALINEKGQRIDINGRPFDDKGNYIIEE